MMRQRTPTERGLERLICAGLAGHPCEPPAEGTVADSPAGYGGVGWSGGNFHDYDREYGVDLVQLAAFLRDTQPEAAEALALFRGRSDSAGVPDPAAGRGRQARHDRGAAQRDQARGAAPRPVLRHALGSQPAGAGTVRAEPVHRHPAASLQPGRGAAGAGHRAVHQRAAGVHLRAEEQPHQADGGRRGPAVSAGSQPAREAVRVRALHRALRRGRARGAVLHPARRQGVVVPAVQPGLERRRGQPAQPGRAGDRLPVAGGADLGGASPTSWRTTPRWWRRRTRRAAGSGGTRSGRATTSSTWCAACWPTPAPTARAGAT